MFSEAERANLIREADRAAGELAAAKALRTVCSTVAAARDTANNPEARVTIFYGRGSTGFTAQLTDLYSGASPLFGNRYAMTDAIAAEHLRIIEQQLASEVQEFVRLRISEICDENWTAHDKALCTALKVPYHEEDNRELRGVKVRLKKETA